MLRRLLILALFGLPALAVQPASATVTFGPRDQDENFFRALFAMKGTSDMGKRAG